MYYTQEQINRANQADLVSFLQSQGEQLTRAGNEYRWKRHVISLKNIISLYSSFDSNPIVLAISV